MTWLYLYNKTQNTTFYWINLMEKELIVVVVLQPDVIFCRYCTGIRRRATWECMYVEREGFYLEQTVEDNRYCKKVQCFFFYINDH